MLSVGRGLSAEVSQLNMKCLLYLYIQQKKLYSLQKVMCFCCVYIDINFYMYKYFMYMCVYVCMT